MMHFCQYIAKPLLYVVLFFWGIKFIKMGFIQKREIKFRYFDFDTKKVRHFNLDNYDKNEHDRYGNITEFTGIKDKNKPNNTCIYEGDIISLHGIVIGNIYENEEMAKERTNLIIKGFGTKDWRVTEKKAMDRGCFYSE